MRLLPTLSLRLQLLIGVVVSSLLFGGALWVSLDGITTLDRRFTLFIDRDLDRIAHLQNLQADGEQVVSQLSRFKI